MSINAMSLVWDKTPYPTSQSYILMAIADVVNDANDYRFYMSVGNLAKKVKCSERTVQRALHQFEEDGWLTRTSDGLGGSGIVTEYIFNFERVSKSHGFQTVTPVQEKGDKSGSETVTNVVSIPITKPNINPIKETQYNEEVFEIAEYFADKIEALGAKRPLVTQGWLADIDRMIRIDGREVSSIKKAIDWVHADPFWSTNILSPAKLRKQYEQLRLKAMQSGKKKPTGISAAIQVLNEENEREEGLQAIAAPIKTGALT